MNLFEKIGNDEIKLEGSKKLKIVNEELNEIYKIPLKYLYYNDQNDRIATFVSEYESDNNIKIKDLDVESRNRVIEDFISKSDNDKFEKTKSDIFAKGQQETAFVLKDGRVIDGNRRFTCLRQLSRDGDAEYNYLEAYILDLNIENNYKEIKRLELEIQHGKDEKVKYDPIDFLVGIYRDVEEKKVLNIDEYSEFSGFNKKDLKNKLDEAKLMMEFLDYIDRPRRYHIAKELKMDGPLVEALNILKKIKDPVQKEKMKQQIFILIYSKDGNEDVGKKFIRPLNTIVNNPEAIKEYLEKTDSHRETTLEKIQEINDEVESYEVSKSYDESKKKFDEVSGTQKEEYSKVVENILIKIDAEKQQNTALVFLKKASGDIINIKEDHFILTTKDQEEEVLDKIKEIIYDLKNIEKMIQHSAVIMNTALIIRLRRSTAAGRRFPISSKISIWLTI